MQALADADTADKVAQDTHTDNNSDGECNELENIFWESSNADEERGEEGQVVDIMGLELNGLYEFDLMALW
ncbi:hypothetical protein BDR04DRAFT_1164740 [Suillus decipiens]|nr:hypothetical protein BDR04DRAFT_1164740 [Suillus decipiens]